MVQRVPLCSNARGTGAYKLLKNKEKNVLGEKREHRT